MIRGKISSILRQTGLIFYTDKLRFYLEKNRNKQLNSKFKKEHPTVALPPDYLIYESFRLDYDKYYNGGKTTANWLIDLFSKHTDLNDKNILDWGCGPARTIRHFPQLLPYSKIFATDYNKNSIDWCKKNIPNVEFNNNELVANLPYANDFIDVIYGISIFTHLSKEAHFSWFNELIRVLKPRGIMLLSLQGDNFKEKLTEYELTQYNSGKLVVRGKVKEGHRTYSAFHPTSFVNELFKEVTILEHIVEAPKKGSAVPQDIWIVRKE